MAGPQSPRAARLLCYRLLVRPPPSHLGVSLALDHKASPFVKKTMDISCYHYLEAHLDGFCGTNEGFELRGRDSSW